MKQLFRLGFAACLTTAFVFSGCTKDDDDDNSLTTQKGKLLLSQLCEYTDEAGASHQELREYKYDGKGNTIENNYTETVDGAVTRNQKSVYEYDNKGNQTKREQTSTRNGVTSTTLDEYKYDDKGHQLEENHTSSENGEILNSTSNKHKFNEYGDETEHEYISDGDVIYKDTYEYEYDADGNKTKHTYYHDGKINAICEYTYVDDTVKMTYYDKDGNITSNDAEVYVTVNNEKQRRTYISGKNKVIYFFMEIDNKEGHEQYYKDKLCLKSITTYEGNTSTNTYEYYNVNNDDLMTQRVSKYVYTNSDRTEWLS